MPKRKKTHNCPFCRTVLFYNTTFDAWWCPRCDKWAEDKCGDDKCDFCSDRPDHPSQVQRRPVNLVA